MDGSLFGTYLVAADALEAPSDLPACCLVADNLICAPLILRQLGPCSITRVALFWKNQAFLYSYLLQTQRHVQQVGQQ